jgi:hypothetical protein
MIAWLENAQARQLTELYRALRLYINCFQPSMKLQSKQRDGKEVRCVYDPAKTPSRSDPWPITCANLTSREGHQEFLIAS